MFETAELGRSISKEDYMLEVPELRTQLLVAQNELRIRSDFSVIIVIGGVDGAGKGETVNRLHEWMDPRFLQTNAYDMPNQEERERPGAWRFWRDLPPKGTVGMFFGSWYTGPIIDRVYKRSSDAELDSSLVRINTMEKALADDGTLLLKYWFHLSKNRQKKRLRALSEDSKQRWRVTERDWKHFELYDSFVSVCERALRETSTGYAPWTVIEGTDPHYRELTVGRHILKAITEHRERHKSKRARKTVVAVPKTKSNQPTILDALDMSRKVSSGKYNSLLEELQGDLAVLSRKALEKGVSTVMVFEGWDAAGKGGAVRRITGALDARLYRVIPIAAPSSEELARHYLWRFWRHLPQAGHMAIFDRSWYGRVLVERVEGFATKDEWVRAYKEINDFEEHLALHGIALVKFWLHIEKDEQLRRFKEREKTSYKKYKITREDYRNRSRWDDYRLAVNDMVERTSTEFAPWTLVEANDKKHARIKVLETCRDALKMAIKKEKQKRDALSE